MQEIKPWPRWQKWTMGVLVGIIVLVLLIPKPETEATAQAPSDASPISQAAVDSAAHAKKIEKIFSVFNGSNRKLVEVVKTGMNDPESFEHIKTVYWDRDSVIVVKMEYTGKNAYGGRVRGTVMARCNLDGDVIKIMASE